MRNRESEFYARIDSNGVVKETNLPGLICVRSGIGLFDLTWPTGFFKGQPSVVPTGWVGGGQTAVVQVESRSEWVHGIRVVIRDTANAGVDRGLHLSIRGRRS